MMKVTIGTADEAEGSKAKKFSDHELAHMADTIQQAHEHMADPALMKLLEPHLEKKTKAIKSIADLKKKAKKLAMADAPEEVSEDA